jgi:two-component system, cell cycle response regulator
MPRSSPTGAAAQPSWRLGGSDRPGADVEWKERVASRRQALERLARGGVDVILLDLMLPDSRGMVTFEQAYAFAPDVPIVVLTDDDDEEAAIATVQGGAQDYLVKRRGRPDAPGRGPCATRSSGIASLGAPQPLAHRRPDRPLQPPGLHGPRKQYLKLARRSGRGGTDLYLDLDRFKTINDSLGHHVGDRALLKVADILRASFRRSDMVARVGGDEFAVLALEAAGESAERLVERVRERVEDFNERATEPYQLSCQHRDRPLRRANGRVRLEDLLAKPTPIATCTRRSGASWA